MKTRIMGKKEKVEGKNLNKRLKKKNYSNDPCKLSLSKLAPWKFMASVILNLD